MSRVILGRIKAGLGEDDTVKVEDDLEVQGDLEVTGNATVNGDIVSSLSSFPGGIVQVKQAVLDSRDSYSGITDFIDLVGLSVEITPKLPNSFFLLRANIQFGISPITTCNFRWVRNGTPIALGATGRYGQASFRSMTGHAAWCGIACNEFLDSPATSSPLTYKIQLRPYDSSRTVVINNSVTGTTGDDFNVISTITVMEIAQ